MYAIFVISLTLLITILGFLTMVLGWNNPNVLLRMTFKDFGLKSLELISIFDKMKNSKDFHYFVVVYCFGLVA
jgi:hypothetical protein